MVTSSPDGSHIPVFYGARFNGKFIGHMHVKASDIGATGDRVNKLMTIRSSGEKPEVAFIYTNKDATTPPGTITERFFIQIDDVSRLYSHADLVRYRILGKLVKPSTIVVT